ncbi:sugar nucleotide-binding protein [Tessaracoccus coleopterorum]|uniref:sugar nucleotide-binding protein n=1 Tax=Tessaracoccus coleopterorum TaxID=2714950 RepID=UPI002F90F88A
MTGLARLVERAREHGIAMVQVSSDYVFDGTREVHHEDEPSPRWACTDRRRPPARRWWRPCRDTGSCAPAG